MVAPGLLRKDLRRCLADSAQLHRHEPPPSTKRSFPEDARCQTLGLATRSRSAPAGTLIIAPEVSVSTPPVELTVIDQGGGGGGRDWPPPSENTFRARGNAWRTQLARRHRHSRSANSSAFSLPSTPATWPATREFFPSSLMMMSVSIRVGLSSPLLDIIR